MAKIEPIPVPPDSLLAAFGPASAYRDTFTRTVPGSVSLEGFITRFYCSMAFRPERLALGLIGRGASNAGAMKLARAETQSFAAWNVIERRDDQILLQDFSGATASWLSVRPESSDTGLGTQLLFGSWVGQPDRPLVKALMPFHRWYSRWLLSGV